MIDNKAIERVGAPTSADNTGSSIQAAGCLCKKQVFYLLRPNSRRYYSRPVHEFFTDDLLNRCGITRDEMKHIRVFPPEVNFIVVSHLKTLRLL